MPEVTMNITERMGADVVAATAVKIADAVGTVTVDKGPREFKVTKLGSCYEIARPDHSFRVPADEVELVVEHTVEWLRDVVPF